MRVAFFEVNKWEVDKINEAFKDVIYFRDRINEVDLEEIKDIEILSIWIYSKITKDIIDVLPNLKLIVTRSTGVDHIDTSYCKEKGIRVCNIPRYGSNTVAEHTFALIINLLRKVHISIEKREFQLSEDILGSELRDKTLGVIGTGSIGKKVIQIAKAFDMNILAYDIKRDIHFARSIGFKYLTLDELLTNSDIVTLHIPLTRDTYHLIDMNKLDKFKNGCYLINTARGSICNTASLLAGLERGIFAGIALDVLEEELLMKSIKVEEFTSDILKVVLMNYILFNHPRVIITPHSAFYSREALNRIIDDTITIIKDFMSNAVAGI